MNKLLSAGFFRLKKNLLFWLSMVFMAIAGISFPLAAYADSQKYGLVYTLEGNFFTSAVFAVILSSVFCSLFIGADYSSGTIRNKVIAGHNRVSLYLANLVICIAGMSADDCCLLGRLSGHRAAAPGNIHHIGKNGDDLRRDTAVPHHSCVSTVHSDIHAHQQQSIIGRHMYSAGLHPALRRDISQRQAERRRNVPCL